jgi:Na+/H+ antiporter NhaD/arsenite permease-like protein
MLALTLIFVVGYLLIALERPLGLEKSAIALLTGGLCWTAVAVSGLAQTHLQAALGEHVTEIASITFFLLGAMTIVEVIDSHGGFTVISGLIRSKSKKILLVIISLITFAMSALLDNLTTTIVMVAIARKLLDESEDLLVFAGMIVIAANAGGVFSPIGDVTTTMLWIGGRLSAPNMIISLFAPALAATVVPLAGAMMMVKGAVARQLDNGSDELGIRPFERRIVLFLGLGLLALVPVFKILTGLPPYLSILLALGILWLVTELLHHHRVPHRRHSFSVASALTEIDLPSILFFVGILLAVAALQTAGILGSIATWMTTAIGNLDLIIIFIGLVSAIVDNVPLVSAAMNMFPLAQFPIDSRLWELLAFCAGTGGSLLIIGSAAGITAMGASKISFGWYTRRFSVLALIGFASGIGMYLLQSGGN